MRLGIDFGTCYSNAAIVTITTEQLKSIQNPAQLLSEHFLNFLPARGSDPVSNSVPSSFFIDKNGKKYVGFLALEQRRRNPRSYKDEIKRHLGETVPFYFEGNPVSVVDVIAEFLKEIKNQCEQRISAYRDQPSKGVVITVPASYQEEGRKKIMMEAAHMAGFSEVDLLAEPVAAGYYYSSSSGGILINEGEVSLVYDLGGGTFDAALIKKNRVGYEVVGMARGIDPCGGNDFDGLMFADFLKKCNNKELKKLLNTPLDTASTEDERKRQNQALIISFRIKEELRKLKHRLSSEPEGEALIENNFDTISYQLTVEEFNRMIEPMLRDTVTLCNSMVRDFLSGSEQLTRVLLIGGSSQIPYVKQLLEEGLNCPVVLVDKPTLAVCCGAAVYAAEIDARIANGVIQANGDWGKYSTFEEAIRRAQPEDKIMVMPGVFRETVRIEKPVNLFGAGNPAEIIVEQNEFAPCLILDSEEATISGITFKQCNEEGHFDGDEAGDGEAEKADEADENGKENNGDEEQKVAGMEKYQAIENFSKEDLEQASVGILILSGHPILQDCLVTSHFGLGICIAASASPTITNCKVSESNTSGVLILNAANAAFSGCEFSGNKVDAEGEKTESFGAAVCCASEGEITFKDCSVNHNESAGFMLWENSKAQFEDCSISANRLFGAVVDAGGTLILKHCSISENQQGGIISVGHNARAIISDNCSVSSNFDINIGVEDGGKIEIFHSVIGKSSSWGIKIGKDGDGVIEDCQIVENQLAGVYVHDGGHVQINNSTVSKNAQFGIYSDGAHVEIMNCDVAGNKMSGVGCRNNSRITIGKCFFHENEQAGIALFSNSNGYVGEKTEVHHNGGCGIYVCDGSSLEIENCKIYCEKYDGIQIKDQGKGRIENCQILESAHNGIVISSGVDISIHSCKISGAALHGIEINGQSICIIKACEIIANTQNGVLIGDNSNVQVDECIIRENKAYGVEWVSGNGVVENCDLSNNSKGPVNKGINASVIRRNNQPLQLGSTVVNNVAINSSISFLINPSGIVAASTSTSGNGFKVWDTLNKQLLFEHILPSSETITAISISQDAMFIAVGNAKGEIHLWKHNSSSNNYVEHKTLRWHNSSVKRLVFHPSALSLWTDHLRNVFEDNIQIQLTPDDQLLLSSYENNAYGFWNTRTGCLMSNFNFPNDTIASKISPDGKWLALLGTGSSFIKIWRLPECSHFTQFYVSPQPGFGLTEMEFSADSKSMIVMDGYNTVSTWDFQAANKLRERVKDGIGSRAIAISPDMKIIALPYNNEIKLMDFDTLENIQSLNGHKNQPLSLCFLQNQRTLVSCSSTECIVWEENF